MVTVITIICVILGIIIIPPVLIACCLLGMPTSFSKSKKDNSKELRATITKAVRLGKDR